MGYYYFECGLKQISIICLPLLITQAAFTLILTFTKVEKGYGTMLTPELAAIILLIVSVLLLIAIPILDGSERFSKYISLRYILVAVTLIMALGCVLDFSHLAESSRNIVLMGGVILVGLFVVVRSLEKMKLGGKKIEISVEKGDTKASATLQGEQTQTAKNLNDNKAAENKESTDVNGVSSEAMSCAVDECGGEK